MDARTLEGSLLSAAGRSLPDGIPVWFAWCTVAGDVMTVETASDAEGHFSFELPAERLESAIVGAVLEGVRSVDLEPMGEALQAGNVVLVVDDLVPLHLRYGCIG